MKFFNNQIVAVLQSGDVEIVNLSLYLLKRLFEGGNKVLQSMLLKQIQENGDALSDIKGRLSSIMSQLKNKRKAANKPPGMVSNIEDEEQEEEHNDYGLRLLQFLQNTCEGHFTLMKDYLRTQPENTRSFNLVLECVTFAGVVHKSLLDDIEGKLIFNPTIVNLAIQLFRTLTEFCSGCAGNVETVVNAKIIVRINRYLRTLMPATGGWVTYDGYLLKKHSKKLTQRYFVIDDGHLRRYSHKGGNLIRDYEISSNMHVSIVSKSTAVFEIKIYKSKTKRKARTAAQILLEDPNAEESETEVNEHRKLVKTMTLQAKDSATMMEWIEQLVKAGCKLVDGNQDKQLGDKMSLLFHSQSQPILDLVAKLPQTPSKELLKTMILSVSFTHIFILIIRFGYGSCWR